MKAFQLFTFVAVIGVNVADFQTDYLYSKCNQDLGTKVSGRLETSTSLTYENKMDCHLTIGVRAGRKVMFHFNRFDVEEKLDGVCTDAFNFHDGENTAANKVNTQDMCGEIKGYFNMSSTANKATIHFSSDNTAQFRGFEVIYTEYYNAPCDAPEYACHNGICIDPSLECNGENECGDRSDESHCTAEELATVVQDEFPWGLVIGCSVAGLILIIIIIVVAYKVYDYYYWQKWMKTHMFDAESAHKRHVRIYEYPVTDKYTIHQIGRKGRRKPDVNPYFMDQPAEMGTDGKYLDEY